MGAFDLAMPTVLLGLAAAASSCSRPSAVPSIAPDDSKNRPQPTASAPPSATVPTDASAVDATDAGVVVLPPHVDTCASDSECGATYLDVSGPTICCFRCCSVHGGSKSWVDAVETICKTAPKTACTDVACACPMPPFKPKCTAGHCVLTY